MDADSSYGGSDTAQDSHSGHDTSSSLEAHHPEANFYKNEITLPVNCDETDFQESKPNKQPHYLSTANLNINETLEHHSNLEEMSKNYKSTSYLNQSPKSTRKDECGVDNPAFQEEDCKTEVKSTFDNNKPYNGDLNSTAMLGLTSPTKEESLTEAVNLELINLKPTAGKDVTGAYENGTNGMTSIPVKKENDPELGNPYDEYFVPVNEHRKYMSKTRKGRNSVTFAEMIATSGVDNMTGLSITAPEQGVVEYPDWLTSLDNTRGEKLYVTMDKRNKKKRNKCLCWGLCLCIVAAAVIIGILAAVGVIGNQGPQQAQEVSARHFGNHEPDIKAAGGIFGLPKDIDKTTIPPETETQRLIPGPPLVSVPDTLPTTETSTFQVPRALESLLVIDNLQFIPALEDKNSTEYKELAETLETELKHSLFSSDILNYGAADIQVKVVDFASGSVLAKYRITWVFRDGIHNAKDPIDEETLKRKMHSLLQNDNGFISNYHVADNTMPVVKLLNLCKIENNKCEYGCSFDYNLADFLCSCPEGKSLGPDQKSCIHTTENPEPEPEPTVEPVPEPKSIDDYHNVNFQYSEEALPEPTSAPEPEPTSAPEPEPTSAPEPEPTAAPQPEPTTNTHEETHQNYVHYQDIETLPEPTTTQSHTHDLEPSAEPKSEPLPVTEHSTEPEATAEPLPISEHITEPAPEPKSEPFPITEHITEPSAEPKSEPLPITDHTTEPAAEPTAEPKSEPLPIREHITEPKSEPLPITDHTTEPAAEPTAEPAPEPKSEPLPIREHSTEPESTAEPLPIREHITEPSAEPKSEPLPTTEPNTEPVAEPAPEPKSEPLPFTEHNTEPAAEPTAEPTPEPEPNAEPTATTHNNREHFTTEPGNEHITEKSTDIPTTTTSQQSQSISDNEIKSAVTVPSEQSTTPVHRIENQTETSTEQSSNQTLIESATRKSEQEARHLYLSDAILAEPETTTLQNTQSEEVTTEMKESSQVTTTPNQREITTQENLIAGGVNEQPRLLRLDNSTQVDDVTQAENSTELITTTTQNITHGAVESTENTSGMDNMSPFLPEIDNDTFVNKLHLGEHIIPNAQNETHYDDMSETSPPRLDNDQMNYTNPQDSNSTDATLNVVPLDAQTNQTELLITPIITTTTESAHNLDKLQETTTSTVQSERQADVENSLKNSFSVIPVLVQEPTQTTTSPQTNERNETTKLTGELETTLPPEIINNVHSNTYFDNIQNMTASEQSSEDLLAMETTTTALKTENKTIDDITEASKSNQTQITTIRAEILESATDTVNFTSEETTTEFDSTTVEATTHNYEVNEAISEPTTTEKLFLTAKATTQESDLSVVPLDTNDDSSKVEEKRVAVEPDSFGDNDISEEEHAVLDKFQNDLNEIAQVQDVSTPSSNSKFNKKSYYDKKEKKAKLEKVLASDDELLTTTVPDDKHLPFSDIKPVTEDFSFPKGNRCGFGQFQCVNGTSIRDGNYCISEKDRCDSVNDCSDASDEIDCVKNGCPHNFQCASGQCLKRHLVCDGIQNCNDGSDEVSCEDWSCNDEELSCGQAKRCLPRAWRCDGRSQCPDGSDEFGCVKTPCGDDSFHCTNQNTCIPKAWRCDGKSDCTNSEDETSCECGRDEFRCATGGGCIKSNETCDGIEQCPDKSDEWNCLRMDNKYLEVKVDNMTYPICADNWNQTYSDAVCRLLGFGMAASSEPVSKPDSRFLHYYKIKPQSHSNILSQLDKSDTCDSFISVTCQEFTCGSSSTSGSQSARIIGGNPGTETQWPSLTLLYNKKRNVQCTATLITPVWSIASHSCVFGDERTAPPSNDWVLYAGSTNFFGNTDNSTTQVAQVERIVPHPQAKFTQFELINDVVLVELRKPLVMTRNVSAMCLPDKDIEPRQLCVIAGWGVSRPGESSKNQYLHYLPVPVIDAEDCNSTKHYNGLMSKDKICAGYTDSDKTPCYNDEGAPLMCFSDSGAWELQGILSHHDDCARSKHPAIYTAMNEKMRRWVINTIGRKPARAA